VQQLGNQCYKDIQMPAAATKTDSPAMASCGSAPVPLAEADLRETGRFLLGASDQAKFHFAQRQLDARRRTMQLLRFYRRFPCRMSRVHLLASCAVTLGRLCGYSPEFSEMGELFMPVNQQGAPQTCEWQAYVEACSRGRPLAVRDELWIAAHMNDMRRVQCAGLDRLFYETEAEHSRDPMWNMVRRHMEVTLGSRLMDQAALSGDVPFETAIAHSFALGLKRLFSQGWDLLRYFAKETTRAILLPAREPKRDLISYRRSAGALLTNTVLSWTAYRTYQRGIKAQERGSERSDARWPLLEKALGPRISEVHPLIVAFYGNPAHFSAHVSVHFTTMPARLVSVLATLLLGQGLYEAHMEKIGTRFRAFSRADGSLHFVRELYCGGALRAFDSDFVIRNLDGAPRLFEIFTDLKLSVAMEMQPTAGGGLLIRGGDIFYRTVRLPSLGFNVEFQSEVGGSEAQPELRIKGKLLLQPRSTWARFLIRRVLRRPEELGGINYWVRPSPGDAVAET
jgi:hypothetical protein